MADSGAFPPVRTTCPYCGVGCGVLVRRRGDGGIEVTGDPDHPANYGRLCSKGAALAETLGLEGRLLYPEMDGRRVAWRAAIRRVAERFRETIAEHGPDSVAFYISGQLLTEDYYVANKLMKGFIGSANIDTNSRLCMASSVAGHRRAFGSDTVPGCYDDLDKADLVVLTGSNLAWCHPVLFQRLLVAREARPEMKIVAIDPRRTATAELADLHLRIRPGGDVALFNGLLHWLHAEGCIDVGFVARHTDGLEAALAAADDDLAAIETATGVSQHQLAAFYALFAGTEQAVTVYSQGVNQAVDGTDRVNAIINCHLFTGRIGRPGMGPFSVTGQPNAMGGREVGGLANQLACHMELDDVDHRALVQNFWDAPAVPDTAGLKAVDLFRAIEDGRIKAVWIMATNPVVSLPEADRVRRALEKCSFVVVSDVERHTDTTALADVLLPAAAWGEKDGTVTNSERRISRQRAFSACPGLARPDWLIIRDVAREMGFGAAFDYDGPADVFREFAALSAHGNHGSRDFDLSGLTGLTPAGYDALQPVQWPVRHAGNGGQERFFAEGGFFTANGRARFVATPAGQSPAHAFHLNTGRIRDQWHTMTRTGRAPRLSRHLAEPFVEIHPVDAGHHDVQPADLVVLENAFGRVVARALITDAQRRGSLFMPMHWSGPWSGAARVDALIESITDPVSGQPALKSGTVRFSVFRPGWYGFAVSVERPAAAGLAYWALARTEGGFRMECAGLDAIPGEAGATALLGLSAAPEATRLQYRDERGGSYRLVIFRGDRPVGLFFAARTPVAVERNWLAGCLDRAITDAAGHTALLAGRPGGASCAAGALICACNGIGANAIRAAIEGGATTMVEVGRRTRAGTGCGSCLSEIKRMLDHGVATETV
ncbi:nitrate reductase [Minwuia thermotolerans]|uniref:nitrate reductase n=1 Tax=Minwuia thermotolerans TaxID=2056226 RepID=UPI000D6DC42D|nr:nitrate reductase [Minwuia thermotolerans]